MMEVPHPQIHESIRRILQGVDWELLHKQKHKLLSMVGDYPPHSKEVETIDGIVNLLSDIQDYAHAKGYWVFPEEPEESDGVTMIGMASRPLAEHFIRGVEFVNDSAVTAEVVEDENGAVFVKITDEDAMSSEEET